MNYYDDWRRLFFNLYGSKIKRTACLLLSVQVGVDHDTHITPPHTHTQTQFRFNDLSLVFYDICTGGGDMAGGREREREKGVTMATEAPKFCNAASSSPPDVGWIKTIRCQNYDHWHVGYLSWRVCSDTSGPSGCRCLNEGPLSIKAERTLNPRKCF